MTHKWTLNRREFLRGGVTVLAGTALAACAPAAAPTQPPPTQKPAEQPKVEPTKAPEPTAVKEPAKVVIFVGFGTGTAPEQIEVHNQLASEYSAAHPETQVEFLTVPWAERNTKFSTMLAGDMAPELCMPIGVGGTAAFFDEWLDIKPFVDRDKIDLSVFVGRTVEFHTYPSKMVGLPIGAYPEVIFYNEDLFDAADAEYPPHEFATKEWTYDALVELAKLLTLDSAGNNATSASFKWQDTVQWGWDGLSWNHLRDLAPKFGATQLAVSDDYKTAKVNSPEWIAMVQWTYDTVWKHHIRVTSEQGGVLYETSGDPFGSNKIGMWECHSWMSYAYKGWTDVFNWDMGAIPMGPVGQTLTDCDADTFVMSKRAKQLEAAWEVAKWFCTPEILPRLTDNWGCVPALTAAGAAWKSGMEEKWP
ncbi:MAG: extracellular solute-binding protein, partial [Anaerolineae bacterium]|nr:extracellular solute-binding protein [Anaerolineae bacterium]